MNTILLVLISSCLLQVIHGKSDSPIESRKNSKLNHLDSINIDPDSIGKKQTSRKEDDAKQKLSEAEELKANKPEELKANKPEELKANKPYTADWQSLDGRPLPNWYDEAKIGIFMHWGVFSVPSYSGEWFWWSWQGSQQPNVVKFMKDNYPPDFTYADFAPQFQAEFFKPDWWADLFKDAGAKYVVLTSKHHEGYTNWPSKYSWNWNSKDVGPNRDLVGDLADAIRKRTDIHFGLYHSLFEWFHPLYLEDKNNNFKTTYFPEVKTMPELYEIVNTYKPEVVWSDGEWEALDTYWNSTGFLAWLYNESPVKDSVVVNDRWGSGTLCTHGGYYTCNDRYNPGVLQLHKWENAMTIDKSSWGYRREATLDDYLTTHQLISQLASTVSCGGNLLINIGPTPEGTIMPLFEERLRQFGRWLRVNGDAIYSTKPWLHQNDTITENIWYTANSSSVYAIVLFWPANNTLVLGAPVASQDTKITLLGQNANVPFVLLDVKGGIVVTMPYIAPGFISDNYAWVLKIDNLANL